MVVHLAAGGGGLEHEVDPLVRGDRVLGRGRDDPVVDPVLRRALGDQEDHLAVLLGQADDRAADVAVPAHAEVDLAAGRAVDERRVDRVDVRLDVDQQLLGLVDLALVLGVDRVAERRERERDDLRAALEEVDPQVLELAAS